MRFIKIILIFALIFIYVFLFLPYSSFAASLGKPFQDIYNMISDNPTLRFSEYFSPSTIDNGHIWVDKTVSEDIITFEDYQNNSVYTIDSAADEFLVTLSALSQSYSVETIQEPTDVAFILDISGSMYSNNLGNQTRAKVMIDALNNAIHMIMDANHENRITVVAYGGYTRGSTNFSRCVQILKLAHYDVTEDYISIRGNVITVHSDIPTQLVVTPAVRVEGGTPTQRGIYMGAKMLMDNEDTQYIYTTKNGKEITVNRRPVMVLLTDGDPTFGWRNYMIEGNDTDIGYDCANGYATSADMGIDLLTVLTASYWKQQVRDHYYGNQDRKLQFYTVGVGVSGIHAPSVMDPAANAKDNSINYDGTLYNMATLLDQFIDSNGGSITFPAFIRGSSSIRNIASAVNLDNYVKSYAYTDGYFPADDKQMMDEAFKSIALDIITMGSYTTEVDPANPDFSGYLVISDSIGENMKFRDFKGAWVKGEMHDGKDFAKNITEKSRGGTTWYQCIRTMAARFKITKSIALEILMTNIAGGELYYNSDDDYKSVLRWYANNAMGFVGFYYDRDGVVQSAPEGATCIVELYPMYNDAIINDISGTHTSLMNMYMIVTTALVPGDFDIMVHMEPKIPILAQQQMVGWYIPASLIPMRTVSETYNEDDKVTGLKITESFPISINYSVTLDDNFDMTHVTDEYKQYNQTPEGKGYYFYCSDWRYHGNQTLNTSLAVFEPNISNSYYYFTEDTQLFTFDGTLYTPADGYHPNTDYYYIKKYFDDRVPGYIAEQYTLVNQQVTKIMTDLQGIPYVPKGERRKISVAKVIKQDNITQTFDYKVDGSFTNTQQLYLLGNNGRIEIRDSGDITVHKIWNGVPSSSIWVQLYADGVPIREPVLLDEMNNWQHTWPEVLAYTTKMDENEQVYPVQYNVMEGECIEGIFIPYSESNLFTGYWTDIVQPEWNAETLTWSNAVITNTAYDYIEQVNPSIDQIKPSVDQEVLYTESPHTGDISNPFLYFLMIILGLTGTVILKKYKCRDEKTIIPNVKFNQHGNTTLFKR